MLTSLKLRATRKLSPPINRAMPGLLRYGPWVSMILCFIVLSIIATKITITYVASNFSSAVSMDLVASANSGDDLVGVYLAQLLLLANVWDLDLDAQTMSVHWSVIGACGAAYTFSGNNSCQQNGLSVPMNLYINLVPTSSWQTTAPTGQYDPESILQPPPTYYLAGRQSIPTSEWDTILPLDQFLPYTKDRSSSTLYYPFETLNSYVSMLALNPTDNSTIPIANVRGYGTVVNWVGLAVFQTTTPPGEEPQYALNLIQQRQLPVKAFVIVIVITNWIMSLTVLWMTIIVLFRQHIDSGLLLASTTILFAIPQIRASMPDAPPFGAFIDIGGYFLNVCLVSCCTSILLLTQLRYRYEPPTTTNSGPVEAAGKDDYQLLPLQRDPVSVPEE
ncbi:hypothetical protein BV22DRAFT_1059079 [Leucogyrophana mollusca]|uniref:Uncharacterized protein n=1 Tax=Leucogyrophana mollusca TaxID=85980 RepID=A0ACB8BTX8_9AGAM|nr:hypothetical protein BV22DRAFT_1059079 [Leucogyrophana mollusca]